MRHNNLVEERKEAGADLLSGRISLYLYIRRKVQWREEALWSHFIFFSTFFLGVCVCFVYARTKRLMKKTFLGA